MIWRDKLWGAFSLYIHHQLQLHWNRLLIIRSRYNVISFGKGYRCDGKGRMAPCFPTYFVVVHASHHRNHPCYSCSSSILTLPTSATTIDPIFDCSYPPYLFSTCPLLSPSVPIPPYTLAPPPPLLSLRLLPPSLALSFPVIIISSHVCVNHYKCCNIGLLSAIHRDDKVITEPIICFQSSGIYSHALVFPTVYAKSYLWYIYLRDRM